MGGIDGEVDGVIILDDGIRGVGGVEGIEGMKFHILFGDESGSRGDWMRRFGKVDCELGVRDGRGDVFISVGDGDAREGVGAVADGEGNPGCGGAIDGSDGGSIEGHGDSSDLVVSDGPGVKRSGRVEVAEEANGGGVCFGGLADDGSESGSGSGSVEDVGVPCGKGEVGVAVDKDLGGRLGNDGGEVDGCELGFGKDGGDRVENGAKF